MPDQSVSVVIVTLNRAEAIGLLLEELSYQDYDNFEIVIVVGPCEDNTLDVLSPFKNLVRIISCESSNISKARNIGIRNAAGDIVIFIDDDAYPAESDWISQYVQSLSNHQNDEKMGIVGGPVLIGNSESYEYKSGLFDLSGFQIFCEDDQNESENSRWLIRVAGGNNAAFKKNLVALNGYDEQIAYYLDETELCARMHKKGFQVKTNDAAIRHYRLPNKSRKSGVQTNRYPIAKSDVYFTIKHSNLPFGLKSFNAFITLFRKHYFKEIFFQSHLNRLNFFQQIYSVYTILKGAITGSWLRFCKPPRAKFPDQSIPFTPVDKKALLETSRNYVAFVENDMGWGSSSFNEKDKHNQQLQFYWSSDGIFSEKNSEIIPHPADRWSKLVFTINSKNPVSHLRLDPMRNFGKCEIRSIECFDHSGELLADIADPTLFKDAYGIARIESSETGKGIELESIDTDPWILIKSDHFKGKLASLAVTLKSTPSSN